MALPIWGIFMKKVLENGKLGVTLEDRFEIPYDYRDKENEDGCMNLTNGEEFLEDFTDEEEKASRGAPDKKVVELEKDEDDFIENN